MMEWMSVWMAVGLIVFLALVAGAVYLGLRLSRRDEDEVGAHEVLDRRFAAGEIDAQEYAERRSALQGDAPHAE
jgi:uncharacterized membrane protein